MRDNAVTVPPNFNELRNCGMEDPRRRHVFQPTRASLFGDCIPDTLTQGHPRC